MTEEFAFTTEVNLVLGSSQNSSGCLLVFPHLLVMLHSWQMNRCYENFPSGERLVVEGMSAWKGAMKIFRAGQMNEF